MNYILNRTEGRKNKGVFTIELALEKQKQKTNSKADPSKAAARNFVAKSTNPNQSFKPHHNDQPIKTAAKNTNLSAISNFSKIGKPWSLTKIQARAKEMQAWIDGDFQVPELVFLGASKSDRARLHEVIRGLGQALYSRLAKADKTEFFSDGDGTCYYKSPIMVDSTSSFASQYDSHWNSLLAKNLHFLGTRFGLLTARPGVIAAQSFVGTESPLNDAQNPNVSSLEEISACIGKQRAEMDSFNVDVFGLSGGLTSRYGETVELAPGSQDFNKLINFIDKEFNFVEELSKIRYNNGDSMRVLEYKAMPAAFSLIPGLTALQYEDYMLTAEKSRKEHWDSAKFVAEVAKLKINWPAEFLNPPDKPGIQFLDPLDKDAEVKLTEVLRDGYSGLICFTPHAIDGTNVYRDDIRARYYDLILKCCRHPKTKAWLEKEFNIPQWADIITINKKDISHIDNFSSLKDLKKVIKDLKDKGEEPNHKHFLLNIIDNNQFYIEIAGRNSKDEVVRRYQNAIDNNVFSIVRGDSKGSDAPALAQAVISGGIGVIVRGLMDRNDVGMSMVDLLREDPANGSYINEGHPDCLKKIGENQFQHLKSGEIKTKDQWARYFAEKYADQIHQIDNIHLDNAIFAFLFNKFFESEGLAFEPSEDTKKTVAHPSELRFRTLSTPDIGFLERGMDKFMAKPEKHKLLTFLAGLPLVGGLLHKLITIENSRPIMTKLLEGIGQVLMWSGAVGIGGSFFNPKIGAAAKIVQRLAAGVNNIAAGITRGLRAPTRYPTQFLGEMCNLVAGFFPLDSYTHKTLWAMGNAMLQLGRAGPTISAENLILDEYKKDEQGSIEHVKQTFGNDYDKYADLKPVAQEIVESRSHWIKRLKPIMGQFLAETVADVLQGGKMTWQFLTVKGFRKGWFSNMFGKSGLTKVSMTSGKPYTNVASVSHLYSASGMFAFSASMLSLLTHPLKLKWLETTLTALGNLIPTFGMMAAARNVEQDQHGYIRLFKDVVGRAAKFDPEKAGLWQRIGSWGMAAGSLFLNTNIGQLLQMTGLGAYTKGIGQEFNAVLEMGAVNTLRKQGEYADAKADLNKPKHIRDFVQSYFGRGNSKPVDPRSQQQALAQAS